MPESSCWKGRPRAAELSQDLSVKARCQLERLRRGPHRCRVTEIDGEGLAIGNLRLPARTVLAAGVAASPRDLPLADRDGSGALPWRAIFPGRSPEVFAGDLATATSQNRSVPGIAPAAKQMGRRAAATFCVASPGRATVTSATGDYGSLATIGRGAAAASVGRFGGLGAGRHGGSGWCAQRSLPHRLLQPAGSTARLGLGSLDLPALGTGHGWEACPCSYRCRSSGVGPERSPLGPASIWRVGR